MILHIHTSDLRVAHACRDLVRFWSYMPDYGTEIVDQPEEVTGRRVDRVMRTGQAWFTGWHRTARGPQLVGVHGVRWGRGILEARIHDLANQCDLLRFLASMPGRELRAIRVGAFDSADASPWVEAPCPDAGRLRIARPTGPELRPTGQV